MKMWCQYHILRTLVHCKSDFSVTNQQSEGCSEESGRDIYLGVFPGFCGGVPDLPPGRSLVGVCRSTCVFVLTLVW